MAQINTLGVIGAGLMGNGIAHVAAQSGLSVVLMDVQQAALDKAMATMSGNMDRQVKKGVITAEDKAAALSRITTATTNDAFAAADMVIEAATENEAIKVKIFGALCPVLKPDAILASNTSSIPITRLAAATDRPQRFIGMHFFNPVPMMKLVEIIRGLATDDATAHRRHRARRAHGQGRRPRRRLAGLRGQPHPLPHDQRGDPGADGRRGRRARDR